MKIFIDTNIFFNHWMLKGAHFQLLSNYIKNTGNQILIPEVIIQEVEHKYKTELKEIKSEITKLINKVERLSELKFPFKIDHISEEYNFKTILIENYPESEIISCNEIDNQALIEKAILGKRPFRENEKGYRDAVAWHSLIGYISSKKINDEIVLITNNSTDFFKKDGDDFKLHQDLAEDLLRLGLENKFTLHVSLNSFITTTVNEKLHSNLLHDYDEIIEEYIDMIEDEFEESSLNYMNNLNINDLAYIYAESNMDCHLFNLFKSFTFDFSEGTEDPIVSNSYKLSKDKISFDYSFNLRRCSIEYTLNTSDYLIHKKDIDSQFFNCVVDTTDTTVYSFVRTYFVCNGILNLNETNIEQMNFDNISFR